MRSNGCSCQMIVWIDVKVHMSFQIGGRYGWGGVREFVYDTNGQAFQLVGFVWVGTAQMLLKCMNGHLFICTFVNSDLPVPTHNKFH